MKHPLRGRPGMLTEPFGPGPHVAARPIAAVRRTSAPHRTCGPSWPSSVVTAIALGFTVVFFVALALQVFDAPDTMADGSQPAAGRPSMPRP